MAVAYTTPLTFIKAHRAKYGSTLFEAKAAVEQGWLPEDVVTALRLQLEKVRVEWDMASQAWVLSSVLEVAGSTLCTMTEASLDQDEQSPDTDDDDVLSMYRYAAICQAKGMHVEASGLRSIAKRRLSSPQLDGVKVERSVGRSEQGAGEEKLMGKVRIVCSKCGSEDCGRDATAYWCVQTQTWDMGGVFDNSFCNACGADDPGLDEAEINEETPPPVQLTDQQRWVLERLPGILAKVPEGAPYKTGAVSNVLSRALGFSDKDVFEALIQIGELGVYPSACRYGQERRGQWHFWKAPKGWTPPVAEDKA